MGKQQTINLLKNGLPEGSISLLATGAIYFEKMGGTKSNTYWNNENFNLRDEFFVVLNSYLSLIQTINKLSPQNDWRGEFDVCFLYNFKLNAQSAYSISTLSESNCYNDAISICRVMHSRLNQLMLFALKPSLFDDWLNNPKDIKYRDGKIRQELENRGINTVQHNYEFASEVIHNQYRANTEMGYFKKGLFPELIAAKNKIYATSKFILAMSFSVMLHMLSQDYSESIVPKRLKVNKELYKWLRDNYLTQNRVDNLFSFVLAEKRHVEKTGKNKFKVGEVFDFDGFKDQVEKFHRNSGQQKTLSKKYENISGN